jgi:sigma-B regulation protein RsbU (phosphoserine phosphatase)
MNENILIVDDDTINRKVIKGIIDKNFKNVKTIEAKDGNEATEIIFSNDITVIILDIMMPEKDGIQVLKEIKYDIRTKNIPVIMYSALHDMEIIKKALYLGALDYFTKPLSSEQMRVVIPLKVKNAIEYYRNKIDLVRYYKHIKDELSLAEQLQGALIDNHKLLKQAEMWAKYIPCEEVGGDILCFREKNEKCWFMVADISGHGVSSAMISMMINVVFNTIVEKAEDTIEVTYKINKMLFDIFGNSKYKLMSAFVGCIEGNVLSYSNSGHPYPYIYKSKEDKMEILETNGLLLGVFRDIKVEIERKLIEKDDTLILYTDGLFDKGVNEGFTNWELIKKFADENKNNLKNDKKLFIESLFENFKNMDNRKFIDDVAIMVIKKN